MDCDPAGSEEVISVATPPDTAPEPSGGVPLMKLTLPVACALTIAVIAIGFCSTDGFMLVLTLTAVVA